MTSDEQQDASAAEPPQDEKTEKAKELQEEELEMLEGVFGNDFERVGMRGASVRVRPLSESLRCECSLVFGHDLDETGSYPQHCSPSTLVVVCKNGSLQPEVVDVLTRIARYAANRFAAEDGCCSMARVIEILTEKLRVADTALTMPAAELARLLEISGDTTESQAQSDPFAASFFQVVPYPCIKEILALLDGCSLARCACVCKQFRDIADDRQLWSAALRREYPDIFHFADSVANPREAYSRAWMRTSWSLRWDRERAEEQQLKLQQERDAWRTHAVVVDPMKLRPPADVYYGNQALQAKPTFPSQSRHHEAEDSSTKKTKKKKKWSPLGGRRYY